jgi:hypothetical protein
VSVDERSCSIIVFYPTGLERGVERSKGIESSIS